MDLIKKNRRLWHISGWFPCPSLRGKHWAIFLWYSLWEPGRVSGGKICKVPPSIPLPASNHLHSPPPPLRAWVPGGFISLSCRHCASGGLFIAVHIFLTQHWFPCRLQRVMWFSCGLPCDLTSFMDQRKAIDLSVCSHFYLLGRSGNFQAPYMLGQKLEVSVHEKTYIG